jgi:membrane fusion protein (multidrug efflux system)
MNASTTMHEKPKRRRIVLPVILIFLAFFLVVAGLGFYKYTQIQGLMKMAASGAFEPPPTAVTTAVSSTSEWKPTLDTIGSIVAINGVTISTDLAGIVSQIAFESGSRIKASALIVQLNTDQEEAQLAQFEAQENLAKLNVDRSQALLAKKTIAQSDYDTSEATYRQAVASVNQYKALIARKTLRAPFDGILGIRQVNLGQYVKEGDSIVTLQSFDPIYVNFNLPQQDLATLADGQDVELTLDAYGNQKFQGKITAINPLVDSNSRNVQLQATFPNGQSKLKPGMYARVSVILPEVQKVVAIPSSSIHYAPYGDSIFVVVEHKDEKSGKTGKIVTEKFVTLGQTRGDLVAIVKGLNPGEEVVTSGVFRLKNNATVTVNNEIKPGSETAPTPADS